MKLKTPKENLIGIPILDTAKTRFGNSHKILNWKLVDVFLPPTTVRQNTNKTTMSGMKRRNNIWRMGDVIEVVP